MPGRPPPRTTPHDPPDQGGRQVSSLAGMGSTPQLSPSGVSPPGDPAEASGRQRRRTGRRVRELLFGVPAGWFPEPSKAAGSASFPGADAHRGERNAHGRPTRQARDDADGRIGRGGRPAGRTRRARNNLVERATRAGRPSRTRRRTRLWTDPRPSAPRSARRAWSLVGAPSRLPPLTPRGTPCTPSVGSSLARI